MLMYFVYYCGAGVLFLLFSFIRWPMTWQPLVDAWAGGKCSSTLFGRDMPAAALVAGTAVLMILVWPVFVAVKKS